GPSDVPRLRIGIVLFENSAAELARLAHSLTASELGPDLQVVVRALDNSPTAALEATVTAALGPATYPWTATNRGHGSTHHLGLAAAFSSGADAYLCLNPDTVLHPRCLRELWTVASTLDTGLVDARTFPEEHPKPYDPETGDTPWCTGTALLVRPAAIA